MKITRLSLWIRMLSLGMWLGRLFFFPFSLIKSAYCARSSVLCNILHACNLSTSENFHICHAVMCYFFLKKFDLFSKTHARFPGFLSRIPLVYDAHQLIFETLNISINISPSWPHYSFHILRVESEHLDTEKWPTKSAEQYLSLMSCTVFDHGLRELVKCERIIIRTCMFLVPVADKVLL